MDSTPSHEVQFRIGDAFPANEPVARWITVLAMMSNDLLRLLNSMIELGDDGDESGVRMLLFRLQAALFLESWTFVCDTVRMWPEIERFVGTLDLEGQTDLRQVREACDENAAGYVGDWIKAHRNVTFHYPEMHPAKVKAGKDKVKEALEAASGVESTITARESFGSVRFGFADEVVVQWLPQVEGEGHEQLDGLQVAVLALARLVQRAVDAYFDQLSTSVIRRTL